MKPSFVVSVVALCVMLLAGCATQGKGAIAVTPRPPIDIRNEVVVAQQYSQVWDKLVRELSKSYYVINNIDKESRIINISFSSNSPQDYVDCGSTSRTYVQGDKRETYNYEIASSSTYKVPTPHQPHPGFAYYVINKRTASLEGRSNIYLAPDEGSSAKTRVAVNTRYVLTVDVRGTAYQENSMGHIVSSAPVPPEPDNRVSFNTNKPVQTDLNSGGRHYVTCFAKGTLEREILDLVRN